MEFIHDGEVGKITVIIESTAITLKIKEDTFILKRISEAEFESFTEPEEDAEAGPKDISTQPIPDKPAAGKVYGKRFKVESATLEEGCLRLWAGEGFLSHLEEFEINLSRAKLDDFSGKTFAVKLNQDRNMEIIRAYSTSTSSFKNRTYMRGFSMKLEFGTANPRQDPPTRAR
jgi:hypothetical protein